MTDLTLAHDLELLSLDPETGDRRSRRRTGYAVVGALLAELALAGRVTVDGRKVRVLDPTPLGLRRADDLLSLIGSERERTPQRWVEQLHRRTADDLLDDLVTAEIVRRDRRTVIGFVPVTCFPEIDGARRDALTAKLREILFLGADPTDTRSVALAGLVIVAGLHRFVFPGESKGAMRRRLEELDDAGWATEAVRKAIDAADSGAAAAAAT